MAQGKFKVKAKVPNQKQKQKGKAFTRRSSEYDINNKARFSFCNEIYILDAPIKSKKTQFTEQQKLKQMVSKTVNRTVEDEIRSRAKEGHINLSKAQQAVAKQQKEKASTSSEPAICD